MPKAKRSRMSGHGIRGRITKPPTPYAEHWVEGSCGTLVWDLKAGVLEYKGDYQAPSQKHTASSEGTRSTSFVAELKHFLACIQGAAKPQNALPEAAEVFGILKSMYLSGQRSGVPIHIW